MKSGPGDSVSRIRLQLFPHSQSESRHCHVVEYDLRSPREIPAPPASAGGLKSEVQHLATGKVPRCNPELRTDSFSLKNA